MDNANANQTTTLAPSPGPAEPVAQVGWRWRSRPGSVERGEISVLAIIETLVAITLAVLIVVKYGTLKHIAWGACLAPFLLLRTKASVQSGLTWFERFDSWLEVTATSHVFRWIEHSIPLGVLMIVAWVVGVAFWSPAIAAGAFVVRVSATLKTALCHPALTLRGIPGNWYRTVFCTDALTYPEVVPGIEDKPGESHLDELKFSTLVGPWDDPTGQVLTALLAPLGVILFAPAILYRWSLKATSLIYAPLLWIVWTTFKPLGLRQRLTLIRRSPLSKIIVTYSCLVALALVVKVYLYATWNGFASWWNSTWFTQTLAVFVQPAEIPLWQVAMFVNACLAVGLFLFAGEAQVRYKAGAPWKEGRVEGLVKTMTFVRGILTVWVTACNLYLVVTTADLAYVARVFRMFKPVLFPWSA